jgi:integrative and conjugative element protein (TIGR02256 family)
MSGLWRAVRFVRPHRGHVEFSSQALDSLMAFRQLDDASPESGGVLLGRLILDSDDVVIDEITAPSSTDERGRFWFKRSGTSAQPRVVSAWGESNGTRIYLGDWHSHPEDDPAPSPVDRRDWSRTLERAVYEQDFLLFAIVGRKSLCLWEGRRAGRRNRRIVACLPATG